MLEEVLISDRLMPEQTSGAQSSGPFVAAAAAQTVGQVRKLEEQVRLAEKHARERLEEWHQARKRECELREERQKQEKQKRDKERQKQEKRDHEMMLREQAAQNENVKKRAAADARAAGKKEDRMQEEQKQSLAATLKRQKTEHNTEQRLLRVLRKNGSVIGERADETHSVVRSEREQGESSEMNVGGKQQTYGNTEEDAGAAVAHMPPTPQRIAVLALFCTPRAPLAASILANTLLVCD